MGGSYFSSTEQIEQATTSADPPATPADAKLDKILAAIAETRQRLRSKVDTVAEEVGLLCDDQRKLSVQVTQTESLLEDLWPTVCYMEAQLRSLTAKVSELEHNVEYFEG
ncbi:hypothetical protein NDU88_001261 [Pleurodeles waltl]|uniref:Uncharacterized protein n=1 Tax=Pleurodeles waltl TaxID=8319 RepID=A0AAV7KSF3_PLEWA|nr:hypothetical protein NDU88_001261 [Pleurodeles waltl]